VANLPVPTPRTYVVGETETGAYFNATRDALNYLVNPPICTVIQTVQQTFGSVNTPVALAFDTTVVDTYGGHSNTVNNSEYVAQVAGWYLLTGGVVFSGAFSGTYRKIQAYRNGTIVAYSPSQLALVSGSFATAVPMQSIILYLNVGDYVQLQASADVASITTNVGGGNQSSMTVIWLHA